MKSYYFTRISCDTLSLDDPLWDYLPEASLDCYHFSPSKGYPVTTATGVWSDKGITVKYKTNERPSDVLARYHGKNEPVCTDSCCEFFFNPFPGKDNRYMNFELSAGGGLLIEVGEGRKNREKPDFELADFLIETKTGQDGWQAKLFIPFSFIKSVYGGFSSGFMGNFYKCGDDTACLHYPVWNKVDLPRADYHRPEFFGKMYLDDYDIYIKKEDTKMSEKQLNIAVIGLGGRGSYHVEVFCSIPNVKVTAVCDLYQDRLDHGVEIVKEKQGHTPAAYTDYHELLKDKNVDAVMITTSWTTHIRIATDAIRAGKHAAAEVCGASSLAECWELVHAVEQTGLKCMFMENCNYGRREMAALNMVKKGIFGEVIHCRGGYRHDLRDEVSKGLDNRHYRYNNFRNRNGELYPTHELGPIAKILNINRGNRFVSLSSIASKARGLAIYAQEKLPEDHPARQGEWTQGDVVTTTLKCAHGETVVLYHDTTLPHPYSRHFYIQGTKGIMSEDNQKVYIEGESPYETWEDEEKFFEKYEHPLWKKYNAEGVKEGGHGGMDWLVDNAYVSSIIDDTPCPIDVYDMATWMAVTVLSEDSIALGGAPVAFPDFTSGRWLDGTMTKGKGIYALDCIDEEAFDEQFR